MNPIDEVVFPAELVVVPRPAGAGRPVVFPVQHQYLEMLWLPVIGPSATWMLRRLSAWASAWPDGTAVVLPELSEALGLGWACGPSSSIQRTTRRLVRFGLADWSDVLAVATMVPPVPDSLLLRMSSGLVRAHDRMIAAGA